MERVRGENERLQRMADQMGTEQRYAIGLYWKLDAIQSLAKQHGLGAEVETALADAERKVSGLRPNESLPPDWPTRYE
jgi:hypothetical protein